MNEQVNYHVPISNTDDLHTPLTFEAMRGNSRVRFHLADGIKDVEYSTDDGASWHPYASGTAIILVNVGDKVSFRGHESSYSNFGSSILYYEPYNNYPYKDRIISTFHVNGGCCLYGNVMSLVSPEEYAMATSVCKFAFLNMFAGNPLIQNHPSKNIVLPAITLASECYYGMFEGCSGLTRTPVLPATTLAERCYCAMFQDCPGLQSVTCLAADISASDCTDAWLSGVAATGTFTTPSGTAWGMGASGIPSGWTRVNAD